MLNMWKSAGKDDLEINKRWKKHISDLLNWNSQVVQYSCNRYKQRPILESINDSYTLEEVNSSISILKMRKAVGKTI